MAIDGLKAKDPTLCDLYVDTHYIDFMLSNLNQEQQFISQDLSRRVKENTENLRKVMEVQDREHRWLQTQMLKTLKMANKTHQLLVRA